MIPRLIRVQVKNYKSLARTVVDLEPFTVFVGPNGAGKSNFIDALAFVQEALSASVELAFKHRGGIRAVRRLSGGHPTHLALGLTFSLAGGELVEYIFEIAAKPKAGFSIARERCTLRSIMNEEYSYEVRNGKFIREIPGIRPRVAPDRLALFAASATEEFRPVYDFLTSMRFYSIMPSKLRELQDPDSGDILKTDGSNAAAVLKKLGGSAKDNPGYRRLCRLMSLVVEGMKGVEYQAIGQKETLRFKQDVGMRHPWTFEALNMSDGTLRVLGLLLTLFQSGPASVIAIEEPEATVHPAITELISQVLMDASNERQIILTTHSPDLIDHKRLQDRQIRAVSMEQGRTLISRLKEASREAIRKRLYTPGELLRAGGLNPDLDAARRAAEQVRLFGRPWSNLPLEA